MRSRPIAVILIGPPGVGKGTLGRHLQVRYDLKPIPMGDILRDHVARKTEIGLIAESYMASGDLAPDEVINPITKEAFESLDGANALFDGNPRNTNQAKYLLKLLTDANYEIFVFVMDATQKVCQGRMLMRLGEAQEARSDDNLSTFQHRWDEYVRLTLRAANFLSAKLHERVMWLDAHRSALEVKEEAEDLMEPFGFPKSLSA